MAILSFTFVIGVLLSSVCASLLATSNRPPPSMSLSVLAKDRPIPLVTRTLVVNMKHSTERLSSFLERWPYANRSVEVLEAFHGKEWKMEIQDSVKAAALKDFVLKHPRLEHVTMLSGEMGCALSHRMAWQMVANMPTDSIVMVLEDDAQFHRDFVRMWDAIANEWDRLRASHALIPDILFLYLGGRFRDDYVLRGRYARPCQLPHCVQQPDEDEYSNVVCDRTTCGYVMTPSFAKQLLEKSAPYKPVDLQMREFVRWHLHKHTLHASPMLVWSSRDATLSTMQRSQHHTVKGQELLEALF